MDPGGGFEFLLLSCLVQSCCGTGVFRDVIFRKLAGAPLSCGLGLWGLPSTEVRTGLAVCFGQGNGRAKIPVRTVSSQALF